MPGSDVVIVGGGIIGAACAYELSRSGASVTLLERDELAAGASGRNIGFFGPPWDPALDSMARSSLELYLEVTADPPIPVHFDREPIGTLAVATDQDDAAMVREEVAAAGRAGLRAERLDAAGLKELEPEVTTDVSEAWLFHEGRRVDPGALTFAFAELARRAGASIRHHLPGRRLISRGESVTGVATDEGIVGCDTVVLAAGPWSTGLLRPLGIHIPVTGARGWLIQLAPPRPLLSHWLEGSARTLWRRQVEPVTARDFSDGVARDDIGAVIQPSPDGTIVAGTSREPAVAWSAEDLDVPRAVAGCVIRLLPALADAPVLGTWSGIRPMSPDERPFVGWLRPGLFAATGHGSEGVILGGGTANLVAAMVEEREPPLDPTPFDPLRFG
jgi:glycine/D-amino acid oxidase-like deaminating enzyme